MYSDNYRGGRNQSRGGGSYRGRGGFGDTRGRYDNNYDPNPPFNEPYNQWPPSGYRGNSQRRGPSSNYRFGRGRWRGGPDHQYQNRRPSYQGRWDNQGGYSNRGRTQGRYPRGGYHQRPPTDNRIILREPQPYQDPPFGARSGMELPSGLSWLCDLAGHTSLITCVQFGQETGKLFSGGTDGKVRQWNPESGQVEHTATYDGEISAMLVTGNYLFVGVHCKETGSVNPPMGSGDVHIYNLSMHTEQKFMAHMGRVTALHGANDVLFTAGEDKLIKAWKFSEETHLFDTAGSFGPEQGGHQAPVNCIVTFCDFMFSGDIRGMIKVWDLQSGSLLQTLARGHNASITSMILYEGSLITGSMDQSISVWTLNLERQSPIVIQTPPCYHTETRSSNGYPSNVISLIATSDAANQDILLTGLASGEVLLHTLPSFAFRGRISEMQEPKALASIPSYCMFIGQRTGEVKIYSWDDHGAKDESGFGYKAHKP